MAKKVGSMSVGINIRNGLKNMMRDLRSLVSVGRKTGKDQYLGEPRNTGTKWVVDIFERED